MEVIWLRHGTFSLIYVITLDLDMHKRSICHVIYLVVCSFLKEIGTSSFLAKILIPPGLALKKSTLMLLIWRYCCRIRWHSVIYILRL
jgi:hypothetical protein